MPPAGSRVVQLSAEVVPIAAIAVCEAPRAGGVSPLGVVEGIATGDRGAPPLTDRDRCTPARLEGRLAGTPMGLSGLRGVNGPARADVAANRETVGAGAAGEVGTDGAGVANCQANGSGLAGVTASGTAQRGEATVAGSRCTIGGVLGQSSLEVLQLYGA